MKPHYLYLLVYILGTFWGESSSYGQPTCMSNRICDTEPDETSHFLQCAGLPPADTGRDHIHRLKEILEATMDLYTFMRSSAKGVPILSAEGALELSGNADPLQNEAVVQIWLEVKMAPLLKSITKQFLSCLSTKNFSCSTYQTVVKELSHHYSDMVAARQKWIYTFFMYPFLSGEGVNGCVDLRESSEEWLIKNFGAFSGMARMKDFSALNMVFSGLEVLHLLSPAQKAELLMRPEVESFDNGTLNLVFHSLLGATHEPARTFIPQSSHSWKTAAETTSSPFTTQLTHEPNQEFMHGKMRKVLNGFVTAFKPLGSFVHEFVSFTHERNVEEIRGSTITQFLLNWTLSELADMYRPKENIPEEPEFDVTNVGDWHQKVVLPLLKRLFPENEFLHHQNITLAFHQLFYLDHPLDNKLSDDFEIQDVCSITLDKASCGLTDAVENVAHILHCGARTNMTMNEKTIMRLTVELTKRLNTLLKELSHTNFKELAREIKEIFGEGEPPALTQEHLNDSDFIQLWFQIKLLPLLPDVHPDFLSCLSFKNFSCPVYQTLVAALGEHMSVIDAEPKHSRNIYENFIYPFLLSHNSFGNQSNSSDIQCTPLTNDSAEWLEKNVGFFSKFTSILDFFMLNPQFSGLDALHLLTPNQTAEMLLLPLPTPPEKDVVIQQVLNFLVESPENRKLQEVLHFVIQLAPKVDPPCDFYTIFLDQLYMIIPTLRPDMEPIVWARISDLINIAPKECVTEELTCPQVRINATEICSSVDSSGLDLYMSTFSDVSCNYTLEEYACSQLENFDANQLASLLMCDLPGNSSHSRALWKILLTKLSNVLNPALDILANMPTNMDIEAAPEILDIIGEMRIFLFTEEQLMDSSVVSQWFSNRLSAFLPSASEMFLLCLSSRNPNCQSYQLILRAFSHQFEEMSSQQQHVVLKNFVLPFLSGPHPGPACLFASNTSAEWLNNTMGPFAGFFSLTELLLINPQLNLMEAISVLSAKQSAELLVLKYPALPETDVIINTLFDEFAKFPNEGKFKEFLKHLVVFLQMGTFSCSSYKTLFTRLDNTSVTASPDVVSSIMDTKVALRNHIPSGCILYSGECNFTPTNETEICVAVNTTEVQLLLDGGKMKGRLCNFSIEEIACASLSALKAEELTELSKCDHLPSSKESASVWKLLVSKATSVLDEALDLVNPEAIEPRNPSVPIILDSIREVRLDLFSTVFLNDPSVLQLWFKRRLYPFLPAVSNDFLSCLATKDLECSSYQHVLQSFSLVKGKMTPVSQTSVYTRYIETYLSGNETEGCVPSSNSSSEWLKKNFGSFSEFASVSMLFDLNPRFNPLEALSILTPKQSAELLVLTHPALPGTDVMISILFNYFTESPKDRHFPEFLFYMVEFLHKGDLTCSSYKMLFARLDYVEATASLDIASSIAKTRTDLLKIIPVDCVLYGGECTTTTVNESNVCIGVNSTELQLKLDSGMMNGRFCDFSVEEFGCASLTALTAQDLAEIMKCDRSASSSGSTSVWKLLLLKASAVLDEALDLLANETTSSSNTAVPSVLDGIREIRLDSLDNDTLNNPSTLRTWFGERLRPFLPSVSIDFLSCLAGRDLNCDSYQSIIQTLSEVQPQMEMSTQVSVYTHYIRTYLSRNDTADPACTLNINSSVEWIRKNVGGFSILMSIKNIQELYFGFSAMEALPLLSVKQLAEVSATPGQLTSADQVAMVMNHITDHQLASFFDNFSPAIMGQETIIPTTVRSAMLEVVFERANLSSPSVNDANVLVWLRDRLRPLVVDLAFYHVTPYFNILAGRNCSVEQQGVTTLDLAISTLSNDTQGEIQRNIIQTLKGPSPLRCYGDSYSYSFYSFLKSSFMGFQFPDLTTFLSLMPQDRKQQLINSMPPSELGDFLRHTDVVGQESQLCQIYSSYIETPKFLETESLPDVVRQSTLPCVWRMALMSSSRAEVNAWFDRGLSSYLILLTKSQISPNITYNASCLGFQKFVFALGSHNYAVADFSKQDVYGAIKAYLTSAAAPRCYDATDPDLNSTAWFAEYIGSFISFLTVEDLQSFGSEQNLQLFTVNPQNLALLNFPNLDLGFLTFYIQLVYQHDKNFSPLRLPSIGQCYAPGPAFTQLNVQESLGVLRNVNTVCTDLDVQISAALASNFGENIDANVIAALGKESASLSLGQIQSIKPSDLLLSLNTLSSVNNWSEGQAKIIILLLLSSGMMQINSSSSLITLGSLIKGVPSDIFYNINGSELITLSQNPLIMIHLMSAPQTVQQAFVAQILATNTNTMKIIESIPNELISQIPGFHLLQFPNDTSTIKILNEKLWGHKQVELFFEIMASGFATNVLGGLNNLSSSVLQGFSCTGVRSLEKKQVKALIRACRREGRQKVRLVESQLTCMYNHIREEPDVTSFALYPPDMLLYLDYSLVPQSSCRSYFQELANADFSVFSEALSYKRTALFDNARTCLGVIGNSLTEENVSVLGNMCCTLNGSYIQNSHPSILEKFKNCPDLTIDQSAAVEILLMKGNSKYGPPSTWNRQTLINLGTLPLFLSSTFYENFDKEAKRTFLEYFLIVIGENEGRRELRKTLKEEIRQSIKTDSQPSVGCTVGFINHVTISEITFPFNYDVNQFNNCLSAKTVKDNLDVITSKVDETEFLKIILLKLRETDNFIMPEKQVQVLSAASRVATPEEIHTWTISHVDTLAALLNPFNGRWDPSLVKIIISKYLAVGGNALGSAELSVIGGANLCSLEVNTIRLISAQSLKEADPLDVSSCTVEKKRELFDIATQAFDTMTLSVPSYQLTQPYMGGASIQYVQLLVVSDINMDLPTFASLDENVLLSLSVEEVKGLLGANLPDLKAYENQPVVQTWIKSQPQSQLDALGINLFGGKADPTTSPIIPVSGSLSTTLSPTTPDVTGSKISSTTSPQTTDGFISNTSATTIAAESGSVNYTTVSSQTTDGFIANTSATTSSAVSGDVGSTTVSSHTTNGFTSNTSATTVTVGLVNSTTVSPQTTDELTANTSTTTKAAGFVNLTTVSSQTTGGLTFDTSATTNLAISGFVGSTTASSPATSGVTSNTPATTIAAGPDNSTTVSPKTADGFTSNTTGTTTPSTFTAGPENNNSTTVSPETTGRFTSNSSAVTTVPGSANFTISPQTSNKFTDSTLTSAVIAESGSTYLTTISKQTSDALTSSTTTTAGTAVTGPSNSTTIFPQTSDNFTSNTSAATVSAVPGSTSSTTISPQTSDRLSSNTIAATAVSGFTSSTISQQTSDSFTSHNSAVTATAVPGSTSSTISHQTSDRLTSNISAVTDTAASGSPSSTISQQTSDRLTSDTSATTVTAFPEPTSSTISKQTGDSFTSETSALTASAVSEHISSTTISSQTSDRLSSNTIATAGTAALGSTSSSTITLQTSDSFTSNTSALTGSVVSESSSSTTLFSQTSDRLSTAGTATPRSSSPTTMIPQISDRFSSNTAATTASAVSGSMNHTTISLHTSNSFTSKMSATTVTAVPGSSNSTTISQQTSARLTLNTPAAVGTAAPGFYSTSAISPQTSDRLTSNISATTASAVSGLLKHTTISPQSSNSFTFNISATTVAPEPRAVSSTTIFPQISERVTSNTPATGIIPTSTSESGFNSSPATNGPIYSKQCNAIVANESNICLGVASAGLQLQLNNGTMSGRFCNFAVEEVACSSLSTVKAEDLAAIMKCDRSTSSSGSIPIWSLLLCKTSRELDQALDILLTTGFTSSNSSLSIILDSIREIRPELFSSNSLNDPDILRLWFDSRLRPFLSSISPEFLSFLVTKDLTCDSYQYILQSMSGVQAQMSLSKQMSVYTNYIKVFLKRDNTAGPKCLSVSSDSALWLTANLGSFSEFATVSEIFELNPQFNPVDALSVLTPKQSAELMALTHPTLPETNVLINTLFDYYIESPRERKFTEFLSYSVSYLEMGNISCSSYKTLFSRLDYVAATASNDVASIVANTRVGLSKQIPSGCTIYNGQCNVIASNESIICQGVNSAQIQMELDGGRMSGRFCDFSVAEFACASLSALRAQDLTEVLKCDRTISSSGSTPAWKLLLTKASGVLNEALDLLANTAMNPNNPAVTMILDSIREIRLDPLSNNTLNDPSVLQTWFGSRLRPFLPFVSIDFLSCLAGRDLQCSSYQYILQLLSQAQSRMTLTNQVPVYTHYIKIYLSRKDTKDPGCVTNVNSSTEWLQKNAGGFSVLMSIENIQELYPSFSQMESLDQLSVKQLAEVSATPGQLTSPDQVTLVMKYVPDLQLASFFDNFSPTLLSGGITIPTPVRSAMLAVVFDRANLSSPSVGDAAVSVWLQDRLRPLVVELASFHVTPFFKILAGRSCSVEQQGVKILDLSVSTLSGETKDLIQKQIVQSLQGSSPLRCYNDKISFYNFLKSSFMGFQFPDLTTFLSLMPQERKPQLINSMPPSELGDFLRNTNVVGQESQLCQIYSSYIETPKFLETESLPDVVRQRTLPCVWPMALMSSTRSEVNTWFDRSLPNYLVFLTKSQISADFTSGASCLGFQKFITVLGGYNYSVADFAQEDVYQTLRTYLTSTTEAATPKCYNSNNPELNSTAWFVEYVGPFMNFLTVDDLIAFGSQQVLQVFAVNPQNLALLNSFNVDLNITSYYTQLVYQQDSNFNPLLLPVRSQCYAPAQAFVQLNAQDSMNVLHSVDEVCTELDPQVSAALASNFGETIDTSTISALGSESSSMSTGQISMIKPADLLASLGTLSNVTGWREAQAKVIIQTLMGSGRMEIKNASSLAALGSLVIGLPSSTVSSISGSELLIASKNPSILGYMMSASLIVRETFVTQIVSMDTNSGSIITNVPDEMASEIPRVYLQQFSIDTTTLIKLNKKTWERQQVELFFDIIATESATAQLGGPFSLSSSVLQGFTCTAVTSFGKSQIKNLIKGCRRKGKNKVALKESQLSCMYNHIRGESDVTDFALYPPDVLLYYDYSLVPQSSCRSYFQELADADFSCFSEILNYKQTALFNNARSCLGITSTILTEDNVSVLGNMCCMLDGSYIQNSDPSILEKLKNCPDLTDAQAAAVETLLSSGKTKYGAISTWKEQTLYDLGMLPLYLPSTFYNNFDKKTKRSFLKSFLKVIKANGVSRQKRKKMKRAIRNSIKGISKRATGCTVGNITQITISEDTFPFAYDDINQFSSCLAAKTVKDNLDAITSKVDDEDYLKIVLSKLREAYNSIIPEDQVQVLSAASRVATVEDINSWTITQVDTLASLMNSSNGDWDASLTKVIISKYLAVEGNKLGRAELNAIGGPNLCSLDLDVIKSISTPTLKEADALNVSSCTSEKKTALFSTATQSFSRMARSSPSYLLMQPYLGGANLDYIRSLSSSNVNMDLSTFASLNTNVVMSLTITEVKNLLGTNLPDLKTYENQTLVQSWIRSQYQSQLDTLGLNLTGGKADAATTNVATTATTVVAAAGSATTNSTATGNGPRIQANGSFSVLMSLALCVSYQLIRM